MRRFETSHPTPARTPAAVVLVASAVMLAAPSLARAQASLAAEDRIDDIPVDVDGAKETFTVIRDARIREQWYYMPDRPRVFERTVDGEPVPELALIRYQFQDPDDPEKLAEGGLLQFAASLALPPEAIPQLEAAIEEKLGGDEPIRLSAMPFEKASVTLYTPKEGRLVASAPEGEGIAPTFATQKMAFSVPLTRIGSDVYDELVHGNTGMPIAVELTFNGLTPPAGFSVKVDWDRTYAFYSKHEKAAAEASWKGLFGAAAKADRRKLRTRLEKSKCIEILVTQGENLSQSEIDKHLQPILDRINQEILEELKPPKKINPTKAPKTEAEGKLFNASYSVALKDRRQVKKGTETIDFDVRQHQTRKTLAAGFIGLGSYPEAVRNEAVTVVPAGPWKSAYFVLPAVGDDEDLGITQVDLEIGLGDGRDVRQSQVVVWTPDKGWRDRNGEPRTVLSFGLMGLEASGFDLERARFETKAQITVRREVLAVEQSRPVFDGETAIATPLATVEPVVVDGSLLSFGKLDPESELAAVNLVLRSGDRRFTDRLRPRRIDARWVPPRPAYWLVREDAPAVTAQIEFLLSTGERVDWPHNGQDLLETLSSLEVTLVDGHWRRSEPPSEDEPSRGS